MTAAQSRSVSLETAIGQMLLVGFRGLSVDDGDPLLNAIGCGVLGGVVLFDTDGPSGSCQRNVASPEQLRSLVAQLQDAAPTDSPLLVSVDQEGGQVRRLKERHGFADTLSPSAAELGEADDPALTRTHALATAGTLANMGINLNLAPTVDVNVNPDNPIIGAPGRSYSADPEVVVAHAATFIRAHHEWGVLCALKHFPGHGSSAADTHVGFTDITDTWSEDELIPFARLIDEGLADSVMTAHVFNSRLDPQLPATLSRSVLTGILRRRLGFDGVVISDDLGMGAISRSYGYETAVEKAIDAGVDMLTLANQTEYDGDVAGHTVRLITRLVDEGRIDEGRIRESHRRVRRLKSRLANGDGG